jgi:hypothetical protein
MKVTMFWHGGSSYAGFDLHSNRDAEVFDTIEDAKRAFNARAGGRDAYYPCVDECSPDDGGPEAWLFFGKPEEHPIIGQEYPDRVMSFGPRGGLIVSRA